VKMNVDLLDANMPSQTTDYPEFKSVLDFIDRVIEEEGV
jgi:hypothetical protein